MRYWSDAEIADIMQSRGVCSARVIAAKYGTTRNAIIGLWHRNKASTEAAPTPFFSLAAERKLDAGKARAIRADTRRQCVIAQEYGISAPLVSRIKSRQKWAGA